MIQKLLAKLFARIWAAENHNGWIVAETALTVSFQELTPEQDESVHSAVKILQQRHGDAPMQHVYRSHLSSRYQKASVLTSCTSQKASESLQEFKARLTYSDTAAKTHVSI